MAVQDIIQYSTTAASNTTIGTSISVAENCAIANWNNAVRELMANVANRFGNSVTLASATTTALGDQEEQYVTISGTTTITSFGTPTVANKFGYWIKFDGALTLTHNATSLILPGGASITTAAGDTAFVQHEGTGNWRCLVYQKASGAALVGLSKTDVTGQSAITAPDHSADYLLISDTSDSGNLKKVLPKYISPVVARYYNEYTTNADLTTAIPIDDTTPLVTEGTQILSVSITTTTATQRVRLSFSGTASCASVAGNTIAWAIFRDSTCIQAEAKTSGYDTTNKIGSQVEDAPAAAATYTYTVRVGGNVTVRMNGTSSARLFGGAAKSVLIAEVIEP